MQKWFASFNQFLLPLITHVFQTKDNYKKETWQEESLKAQCGRFSRIKKKNEKARYKQVNTCTFSLEKDRSMKIAGQPSRFLFFCFLLSCQEKLRKLKKAKEQRPPLFSQRASVREEN